MKILHSKVAYLELWFILFLFFSYVFANVYDYFLFQVAVNVLYVLKKIVF